MKLTELSQRAGLTYGYDANVGDRLTSVSFSDTGTYSITYDEKGRIDYVTYPNNQGTEDYSYDDTLSGRGRLSNITYPNGKSLSFSWNSRGRLTQLTATEGGTITTFAISYDGMNRINQYIKSVGGIQQEQWNFYYGPTGIDKVTRTEGGMQNLSMDFSTDLRGRIRTLNLFKL